MTWSWLRRGTAAAEHHDTASARELRLEAAAYRGELARAREGQGRVEELLEEVARESGPDDSDEWAPVSVRA